MDSLINIFLPLPVGYAVALVVSLFFTFAAGYTLRPLLVSNGVPLPGYHLVTAVVWGLTAFSGCWIVAIMAPFKPDLYLLAMAGILGIFLFNVIREVGVQQTRTTIIASIVGYFLGTAVAYVVGITLHHSQQ